MQWINHPDGYTMFLAKLIKVTGKPKQATILAIITKSDDNTTFLALLPKKNLNSLASEPFALGDDIDSYEFEDSDSAKKFIESKSLVYGIYAYEADTVTNNSNYE